MPGAPAVVSVEPLADEVWLVGLSDGGRLVAKHQFYGLLTHGEPYDLLGTELQVLRALRWVGCPVPGVFGADAGSQLLFLEDAGPRTLAAALTATPGPRAEERGRWARLLFEGLVQTERVLADEGRWGGSVVPGGSRPDLERAWSAATAAASESLERLLGYLGAPRPEAARHPVLAALEGLTASLGRRPPCLGPTDYQPGNLVLDAAGARLTFLELGKLGWDWSERRAVQYATCALAPERPGLVDAAAATAWAELAGQEGGGAGRVALDGHHLVYHLLLARRVLEADLPAAALTRVLGALGAPLSGDPAALAIRRCLAAANPHLETPRA
ncbi:MAG: hypothetical protein ABIL09_16275 [Gemmatimonadota bacterium]